MEQKTIKMLEFPRILEYLSKEAVSTPGKKACLEASFPADHKDLAHQLAVLEQIIDCRAEFGLSLESFPDVSQKLVQINRPEAVLETEDFWDFAAFLRQAEGLANAVGGLTPERFGALQEMSANLSWPDRFASALKRCLGQTGEIRDESSPELLEIRDEMRAIRQKCAKKVNESLSSSSISHYLQDEYLTISSDRYVLALKSNFKGKLQGIIHDYSQTGETCYFEPFFLTELNNNLQKLKRQELEELNKILRYLTDLCRESKVEIQKSFDWMVRMDTFLARARFGEKLGAVPLKADPGAERLFLKNVRHPLLALGGFPVTPIDIALEPGQKALVISGGNAGGKTVCLKTLGLTALMALSALPVPADQGSIMPMWESICVSMVSEQSVEDSLSTFTAQIDHFCRFWPETNQKTLVILDEFGVGTDPGQGAALAQAVVEGLLEKKTWIATATHFPALKAYALSREDVRAASVLFDQETGTPLFRLAYDQVGASKALEVARNQGLPAEIISKAEKFLLADGRKQDEIFDRLNSLAVQREIELERIRARERVLEDKFQKKISELDKLKHKLAHEVRDASRQIQRSWEEQKIGRKKALKELSSLRREHVDFIDDQADEHTTELSWEQIAAGDRLHYRPWDKQGVVQEKDEKKQQLKIDLGGISIWAELRDLELPDGKSGRHASGFRVGRTSGAVPFRLDLRGKFAQDALRDLEQYLDQAILSGRKQIEVVHGKGTGALKAAVHEYLRSCSCVAAFNFASEDCGGEGLTEIELK